MGYYIDFVFEEGSVSGYEEVVDRFRSQGGEVIEDPEEPERHRERFVELHFCDYLYRVTVYKKLPREPKGNWATVRLSWATDPEEVRDTLKFLLSLAAAVGARVYDGQIDAILTPDTIEEVASKLCCAGARVIGSIGKVDDEAPG